MRQWLDLEPLADPAFGTPRRVDILLGVDVYHRLIELGYIQHDELVGHRTALGWTLVGRAPGLGSNALIAGTTLHTNTQSPWDQELAAQLQRFWEIEEVPHVSRRAPEDVECERIFADYYCADDGRYIVRLSLKHDAVRLLGDSLQGATAGLRSLHRRLQRTPETASEYARFMAEYIALSHMKPLTDDQLAASHRPVHYI
ncbi:uncharacterized protein LOC106641330 [Copidosoma floridanum]|uniref:uncharacterized protein LOC106641330 n=1 Tax=Copidosoma floridanum TaxID=29053 RepID=UPI0006C96B97|nr:uncharacterized protein LOC106641330 [Copidosoma floridanum]